MNELERRDIILQHLKSTEYLMVEDLVDITGASIATVRRDLKKLENINKIERFRGGVRLANWVEPGALFVLKERLIENKEVKSKIAKEAAKLIEDGDVIYLGAGSTVYFMIDFIEAENIHVITNSVYGATKLVNKGIPTYILGGEILFGDLNVFGQETIDRISEMNFDKAFIGTSGFDPVKGLSSTVEIDAKVKSVAFGRSTKKYILADSSKKGITKLHTVSNAEDAIIYSDYQDDKKEFHNLVTIK